MTHIANAPEFIKGVVNLRGVIIPILDTRIKFDFVNPSYDSTTVVIVLNLGKKTVGMVVDCVSNVTDLNADQIRPAPEIAGSLSADYLTGLGTIDEHMLIVVGIVRLMSSVGFSSTPIKPQRNLLLF